MAAGPDDSGPGPFDHGLRFDEARFGAVVNGVLAALLNRRAAVLAGLVHRVEVEVPRDVRSVFREHPLDRGKRGLARVHALPHVLDDSVCADDLDALLANTSGAG